MKIAGTKQFKSMIVEEGSWGSRDIGESENTMTLHLSEDEPRGFIEWELHDMDQVEHIGLWFDGKALSDFDGLMCLPVEAAALIREHGYTVSEDFS